MTTPLIWIIGIYPPKSIRYYSNGVAFKEDPVSSCPLDLYTD